jgi:hypothetical protein
MIAHLVMPGYEAARFEPKPWETIANFLSRAGWKFRLPTICIYNGQPLLRAAWGETLISPDDKVCFFSKPYGGGSSSGSSKTMQVVGLVAIIALSAFAGPAAGALASALPFAALWQSAMGLAILKGAIVIGGTLALSYLLRPKVGGQSEEAQQQIYSLTGSGNTARILQNVPVGYGRLKTFPDYATSPWSEFIGSDAYLNVLLCVGAGKYDVEKAYVDDTELWDKTTGVNDSFTDVQVVVYDPGETVDLFPLNVTASEEVSGTELPGQGADEDRWVGGFIVNAAGTTADYIACDFVFPAGLNFVEKSTGNRGILSVTVLAEYRPVDGAGVPTGSYTTLFNKTYSNGTTNPWRITEKVAVTPGRYEVRVRRSINSFNTNFEYTQTLIWAGLRAFLQGPSSFEHETVVAIRIKASAQLSQNGSRKFGLLWTRILPVWNGSAFVDTATQNPLWAFWDAATNDVYGAARDTTKIDFQAVVDEATAATSRGDTFNFVFNQVVPIPEALDKILTVTRCKHRWAGDVITLFRDEWRTPQMLLTDQQIIRGSINIDYNFLDEEAADSVILEYLDEDIWAPAEIQYPPNDMSFTSVKPARIRLDGITNRDHGTREVAFAYRVHSLRRINVSLDTEHDGRILSLGSVIRLQSELPMSWGYSGRVVAVSSNELTLEPAPVWEVGQNYIILRTKTGGVFGPVKVSEGSSSNIGVIDLVDLALVEAQFSTTLAAVLDREDGAEDPSFSLGIAANSAKTCMILRGRPSGERVQLEMVVDTQAVHSTSLATVPSVPSTPALIKVKRPSVAGLYVNFRQNNAEPVIDCSWWPSPDTQYYIAQVSFDDGVNWTPIYQGDDSRFAAVVLYTALKVRVAAVGDQQGPWTTSAEIQPPAISLTPDIVDHTSLNSPLRDYIDNYLNEVTANIQEIIDQIGLYSADQDATNYLDMLEDRRLLRVVKDGAEASIEEVRQVAVGTDLAFASYQVTVNARLDTAESNIATNATAISTLDSSFAAYQVTVDARFDTNEANIATNATAISTLDSSFASYQVSVDARFDTNEANITTNASAIATLDGTVAALYTLTLDVNGYISGFESVNDGAVAEFTVITDIFKIVAPRVVCTLTIASPGVINKTAHGLAAATPIFLETTGTLPTGVTAGTQYYVASAGLNTNDFGIVTNADGSGTRINFTGSQSGTHSYRVGAKKALFTVANRDGKAEVVINGTVIADNIITTNATVANAMSVLAFATNADINAGDSTTLATLATLNVTTVASSGGIIIRGTCRIDSLISSTIWQAITVSFDVAYVYFSIYVDGVLKREVAFLPGYFSGGSWSWLNYIDLSVPVTGLSAGSHTILFRVRSHTDNGFVFNFTSILLTSQESRR